MSWRVLRRGRRRGPGCFSAEFETEGDKAPPGQAGVMELRAWVLLWRLVLLQSEFIGGGVAGVTSSLSQFVFGAKPV